MEKTDAHFGGVAWTIALFIISLLGTEWALSRAFLLRHQYHQERQSPQTPASLVALREPPPAPRLKVDSHQDLELFLRKENERLNSYGWVDRKNGIARVPLQRAMELLLEGKK